MKNYLEANVAGTLSAVVVSACAGSALAGSGADFRGLGDLPGGFVHSTAAGITDYGTAVVGMSSSKNYSFVAYRWTAEEGMIELGVPDGVGTPSSAASAINADGTVVVGTGSGQGETIYNVEPFRWQFGEGMSSLEVPTGSVEEMYAINVSADGSVVVGEVLFTSYLQGFRWTEEDGLSLIGPTSGTSSVYDVSADGSVMVGGIGNEAYRWTETSGFVGLGDLPGGSFSSHAHAVNPDGSVVTGASHSDLGFEAFRWTGDEGMVGLGHCPACTLTSPRAVSGDGSVIVGSGETPDGWVAFIWDQTNGMRNLQEVLINEHGLDLSGWQLTHAKDISLDGTRIVGDGINPDGDPEGWIANLPPNASSIPGDLNGDGMVNVTDLLLMLGEWGACADCAPGNCPADLDGDCNVNVSDLLELLANWG